MSINVQIQSVNPAQAKFWLSHNSNNRHLRQMRVEQYTKDMLAGRWTMGLNAIGFYDDGMLANGQHRLHAIVESGTTQQFIIVRGLTRRDGMNIDTELSRSLVDAARISGSDKSLSATIASTARAIELGEPTTHAISYSERLQFVEKHREAASWAATHLQKIKHITNSATLGAIGRAYYCEPDHERLNEFCQVLATGFSNGEHDAAAVSLRNYLMNNAGMALTHGYWRDTFLKAQNAVWYFMRRRPLSMIKGKADERYPLSEVHTVWAPMSEFARKEVA